MLLMGEPHIPLESENPNYKRVFADIQACCVCVCGGGGPGVFSVWSGCGHISRMEEGSDLHSEMWVLGQSGH